jgi:DNA-binding phage protein
MIRYMIDFNPNRATDYGNDQVALVCHNNWNPDDDTSSPEMIIVNYTQAKMFDVDQYKLAEWVTMIANNRKVSVIKEIRDLTRLGLYESKQIVDKLVDVLKIHTKPIEVEVSWFNFK